jgi:MYXO-CTERM domain-containing protein
MKRVCISIFVAVFAPLIAQGAAGMFDQYVIVNTGSNTYYDIGAATGNPDFASADLGTFTNADSLSLGGQGKSYKTSGSGTDVTGMQLYYRIWQGSPLGSFTSLGYAFQIDNYGGTPGDQQWGTDVAGSNGSAFYSANVLSGLANGVYSLEVYSQITTNGVDAANPIKNDNGGANFTATFTITPEPSRAVLSLLGLGLICLRRRRA